MNTPVNFEIAKLLKEKGFDVPIRTYRLEGKYFDFVYEGFEDDYWGDNKVVNWNQDIIGIKPFKGFVSAPTISEVIMWLYEKHEIWIYPCQSTARLGFRCFIQRLNILGEIDIQNDEKYNNPIEAYEAAIKYCLTNLI
jgi:hypothetical protein